MDSATPNLLTQLFFKELNVSITHSLQYGILHLTIDRVERRNALTAEMFADLADELDQAIMQTAVRVVLLKSSGNVFSAGADLEEMFSAPEDLERETRRFFDSIAKFPKPLIAQVSGPCVGEAFAALLYCDLVYVSPQALFSLPAVALARTPRYGAAQIMAAAAGYSPHVARQFRAGKIYGFLHSVCSFQLNCT